jgi:hypothetical protein
MRLTQLEAAFAQGFLKSGALRIELSMKAPHFEKIGEAQEHFDFIEGFEQEVGCARAQR